MERLKKQQEDAQKGFDKEKERQEERVKANEAALAERAKKHQEEMERLAKEQDERQKAEHEAADKAHKAAIAARKLQQEQQAADHKRRLEERRAQFTSEFGHVWVNGPTGIYMTEITVSDKNSTDKLITDLFMDNVVADVRTFKQPVTKSWDKHGHIIVDDGEHVLVMVVSDDRMKDL